MSAKTAKLLSRGIIVACVAMIVVDVALLVAIERDDAPAVVVVGDQDGPGMRPVLMDLQERLARGELSQPSPIEPVIFGGIALVWLVTGSMVVSRQPRNLGGWLFCLIAAGLPVNGLAYGYTLYGAFYADAGLPLQSAVAVVGEYSFSQIGLVPLLFLLFPDGHPPSRRWAWAVRLLVGGLVVAVVAFALQPGPLNNFVDAGVVYQNPIGLKPFADGRLGSILIPLGVFTVLAMSLATVVAVRQRFRRAMDEERQQMRWLVAVATTAGIGLVLLLVITPVAALFGLNDDQAGGALDPFNVLWVLTALTIFLGIPAAYLVAIFRHGLWELDVVVKKAVVAAVVVVGVTLVGLLALAVLPIAILGVGADWSVVPVVVGIALGLLVGPLRRRARHLADRLVFGKRATPYEVLTAFSERVSETYATEDVLPRMAKILADGTGAAVGRIYLRIGSELREVASWPAGAEPDADAHAVPVVHQGQDLGALAVTMPPNDPMNPSKERLVRDLASQAGLILRNVRLVEELRESRKRIVSAQDERARKLERDIHDGAQQQLVALGVRMRLLDALIERDPGKAREMLAQLQNDTTQALDDLRDLARGIYPPLLADSGLVAALDAQARRSPIRIDLHADGVGRYDRDVEAAVYFCALEALQNVAKYADATTVEVRLSERDGNLVFGVRDDGRGFDQTEVGTGTGLQGMADRIDALGGQIRVQSRPGSGTTVEGRVPLVGRVTIPDQDGLAAAHADSSRSGPKTALGI